MNRMHSPEALAAVTADDQHTLSMLDALVVLAENAKLLTLGTVAAAAIGFGVSYLVPPSYTSVTTIIPPQQQQGGAAGALASLGALAGVAAGGAGMRNPADQYVALMQSVTVSNRIVDRYKLVQQYGVKFQSDARRELGMNVRFNVGKKDGLITIEVDDTDRQRAADIANSYVDELRQLSDTIAVTEAQKRRVFFERELKQTQARLVQAQQAMQASGLTQGALKAEPRSAAEGYARLRAAATAAEVRLQTLRRTLADSAPEIQLQESELAALRSQLARLEQSSDVQGGPDYVSKYREFKYQETLFELYARQFEIARADESREGGLIQIVDKAGPAEKKSKPKRAMFAVGAGMVTLLLLVVGLLIRQSWHNTRSAHTDGKLARLRAALRYR